mmetsp:Transcript_11051/g.42991  ORF Transcript_11051/g.42991 Transcript_11051/m.42991 type:complete len:258 (+) Transcript_11051:1098-1871(+)
MGSADAQRGPPARRVPVAARGDVRRQRDPMPRTSVRAPPRRRAQAPAPAPAHRRRAHHPPPILPAPSARRVLRAVRRPDVPVRREQARGGSPTHQRHRQRHPQGVVPVAGRRRGASEGPSPRPDRSLVVKIVGVAGCARRLVLPEPSRAPRGPARGGAVRQGHARPGRASKSRQSHRGNGQDYVGRGRGRGTIGGWTNRRPSRGTHERDDDRRDESARGRYRSRRPGSRARRRRRDVDVPDGRAVLPRQGDRAGAGG